MRARQRIKSVVLPLLVAMCAAVPTAEAGMVQFDNGWRLNYLVNLTYSMAVRVESVDDALVSDINADDGDRNFDQWSLVNNRFSILGELRLEKNGFGVFLRGTGFYDHVYASDKTDHNKPARLNYADAGGFPGETIDRLGRRVRLLDAYIYGRWSFGGTSLSLQVGDQVVFWGQSLYFFNMAGLLAPADATKSNVPGTNVKQILLPVGQAYLQWGLTRRFSLAAFYQYEYATVELKPVGGYFSTTDALGPGSRFIITPRGRIPKAEAIKADSDDGQWGLRLMYRIGLGTKVALHYIRANAKNPTGVKIGRSGGTTKYRAIYAADIDMYAVSLATDVPGGVALGAELSYRDGTGVNVLVGPRGTATPTLGDFWQLNMHALKIYGYGPLWDQLVLIGALNATNVADVQPIVAGGVAYHELPDSEEAAAYQFSVVASYQEVFQGWDMSVSVATLGGFNGEGDQSYNLTVAFEYLNNLKLATGYNLYVGDPEINALTDRDHLTFVAKYSF